MRSYRAVWIVVVDLVTGISLVLGWVKESPWLVLAEVVTVGVMGVAFGASWEPDPARRWRVGRAWAVRGMVVAVILTGLPHLIGPWSLVVIVALGLLSPSLVLAAVQHGRVRRESVPVDAPRGLSDDELARQWRSSSLALRSSWRTPPEVLVIVLERQRLLDELERRDPAAFTRWLAAAGWRETPSR